MNELPIYYAEMDDLQDDLGVHRVAYIENPANKTKGVLMDDDVRIVASDEVANHIIEILKNSGEVINPRWKEVSEDDFCLKFNVLLDEVTDSESFNDMTKGDGSGRWLVRYKYTGPLDASNRSFCREVLLMNKVFTEEEIKNSLSNPEFGNYSIWDYKGSYGCRHKWKRTIYFEDYEDNEVRQVGFVPLVVSGLDDGYATKFNYNLANQELMQVVAPLIIPEQDIYRSDELGKYNMRFSAETIQKIYDKIQRDNLFQNPIFKDTHNGGTVDASVLDYWIAKDEEDKAFTEYGFKLPLGTMFIHSQVNDKNYWENEIKKNGKYGYSLEAFFSLKKQKQINMNEEQQLQLPDGKHVIGGKEYTIQDGKVTEIVDAVETAEETPAVEEAPAVEETPAVEEVETAEEVPAPTADAIPQWAQDLINSVAELIAKSKAKEEQSTEESPVPVAMEDARPKWKLISDSLTSFKRK